ncbi:hypothetical protein HKD37_11G031466 [Glycine soja]
MTIGGHHELLLLATRPTHREEHFNQRKILRIHLKDSAENKLPILSFVVSETFPPPPTTTDGHHESLLLTARPQHREEHFNQSKILKIHLKDLVEKKLPILSFVVSLR